MQDFKIGGRISLSVFGSPRTRWKTVASTPFLRWNTGQNLLNLPILAHFFELGDGSASTAT